MNLISVANRYYRQIKVASSDNYKKLLKVQELAQAAAIDPYGEYSPEEMASVQKLLKTISVITDKAYRSGIDAPHLKYFVDGAKSQILKINVGATEPVKSQMTKLMNAISEIQMIDIPSQMSGNTAQVMPEETITSSTPNSTPNQNKEPDGKLPQEMQDMADSLSRRPTDKETLWHTPVNW
jgi:hypothetical protein